MSKRIRGVLAPVLTPFDSNMQPLMGPYLVHCRWLIEQNAGLAIFGTNSEAASLSVAERISLTDQLLEAGIPAPKLMPGTGACSITDAIELTRHATKIGAAGALVLPPFYYKGVSDEGLYAYYAEIVERVGPGCTPIYLYHIPQVSGVPISMGLIERLLKDYPQVIAGAKDSSGDWANAEAMLTNFSKQGFDVFPASESFLEKAMPLGAAGCISATANVNPDGIRLVFEAWDKAGARERQTAADTVRSIFQSMPMIPAMKSVLANSSGDQRWLNVRPPLVQLDVPARTALHGQLRQARFTMTNYSNASEDAAAA